MNPEREDISSKVFSKVLSLIPPNNHKERGEREEFFLLIWDYYMSSDENTSKIMPSLYPFTMPSSTDFPGGPLIHQRLWHLTAFISGLPSYHNHGWLPRPHTLVFSRILTSRDLQPHTTSAIHRHVLNLHLVIYSTCSTFEVLYPQILFLILSIF